MVLYIIHKVPLFRRLYFHAIGRPFVGKKVRPLTHLLPKGTPILDIGSGNGLAAHLLSEKGFDIVPMDIHEGQYHHTMKPIVYDGKNIPFPNDHFECGIILTVLHHVDDPDSLLQEIMRVCKRLVIMEDIYRTDLEKRITFWMDSAANLFYSPCPHTNKNDIEWRNTFEHMHLTLEHAEYRRVLFLIRQSIYVVSKKSTPAAQQ